MSGVDQQAGGAAPRAGAASILSRSAAVAQIFAKASVQSFGTASPAASRTVFPMERTRFALTSGQTYLEIGPTHANTSSVPDVEFEVKMRYNALEGRFRLRFMLTMGKTGGNPQFRIGVPIFSRVRLTLGNNVTLDDTNVIADKMLTQWLNPFPLRLSGNRRTTVGGIREGYGTSTERAFVTASMIAGNQFEYEIAFDEVVPELKGIWGTNYQAGMLIGLWFNGADSAFVNTDIANPLAGHYYRVHDITLEMLSLQSVTNLYAADSMVDSLRTVSQPPSLIFRTSVLEELFSLQSTGTAIVWGATATPNVFNVTQRASACMAIGVRAIDTAFRDFSNATTQRFVYPFMVGVPPLSLKIIADNSMQYPVLGAMTRANGIEQLEQFLSATMHEFNGVGALDMQVHADNVSDPANGINATVENKTEHSMAMISFLDDTIIDAPFELFNGNWYVRPRVPIHQTETLNALTAFSVRAELPTRAGALATLNAVSVLFIIISRTRFNNRLLSREDVWTYPTAVTTSALAVAGSGAQG